MLPKLKPTIIVADNAESVSDVPVKSDRAQPALFRKVAMVVQPNRPAPARTPRPLVNPMPDGTLAGEACFAALRDMGVDFSRASTPVSAGSCSVFEPVKLNGMKLGGAAVKFPDKPLLTCGFAAKLALWVAREGAPAVQKATGSPLRSLGTGPGYQCRGRNGDGSAKLSEHAFGNAVDIGYLKTSDGQTINVEASSAHTGLLDELRSDGCRYFTTVLGPGANSAHARHFHFDLERRGKKGNHHLCQ